MCATTSPCNPGTLHDLIRDVYTYFTGCDPGDKFQDIPKMFESLPEEVASQFLRTTLPLMCSQILSELSSSRGANERLPCLRRNSPSSVSLSPKDVYLLVSLSFFCIPLILPDGSPSMRDTTFQLFFANRPRLVGKLHCLVNYFNVMASGLARSLPDRICDSMLGNDRMIVIQRLVSQSLFGAEWWADSQFSMTSVEIRNNFQRIESCGDAIQADFANKHIGGGVMSKGCVQEEIRFVVSPECLAAVVLCEAIGPHEAVTICNTVQFNDYDGYSSSFRCRGFSSTLLQLFSDPDEGQIIKTDDIVCIDAIPFGLNKHEQFRLASVVRELEKCRIGLSAPGKKPFATGNWGCGVFGGDTQLKAVIQWLACSTSGRSMIFHTFEDLHTSRLSELTSLANAHSATSGEIFQILLRGMADSQIKEHCCIDFLIREMSGRPKKF